MRAFVCAPRLFFTGACIRHKVHCMHKGDPPANSSKCAELMFTVHSSHLLLMLTPGHPVTPAHPCSSVAICGHHCSPLLITADQTHEHQDRPLLITAHLCSSLLTTAHPCSSLLTRAHLIISIHKNMRKKMRQISKYHLILSVPVNYIRSTITLFVLTRKENAN